MEPAIQLLNPATTVEYGPRPSHGDGLLLGEDTKPDLRHCRPAADTKPTAPDLSPRPGVQEIDCSASCVRRPMDWRWQLCLHWMASGRRRPPRIYAGDETLRRVFRFIKAVTRGRDPRSVDPDLAAAWTLARDASSLERAHVEARIIAGLDDEQIADRTDKRFVVIWLYEAVFFSVRGAAPSYLVHGLGIHRPPAEKTPEYAAWLIRLTAFVFGVEPLEWLLECGGPSAIASRHTLQDLDDRTQRLVRLKGALAAVTWEPSTPREQRRAIRAAHLLRKAEFAAAKARRRFGNQMSHNSETRLPFIL